MSHMSQDAMLKSHPSDVTHGTCYKYQLMSAEVYIESMYLFSHHLGPLELKGGGEIKSRPPLQLLQLVIVVTDVHCPPPAIQMACLLFYCLLEGLANYGGLLLAPAESWWPMATWEGPSALPVRLFDFG